MTTSSFCFSGLVILVAAAQGRPQAKAPPGPAAAVDVQPLLRLEAGGPTSRVTALTFDAGGTTLYAAGFDKVVRVWKLDARSGEFVPDPWVYRVPVGPASVGVINAIALSPDGAWLAVSGHGATRVGSRPAESGRVYPYLPADTSEMLREQATIYLFHTKTHDLRVLRGHAGDVLQLAFAPAERDKPPLLVSAAREPSGEPAGVYVGRACLWDVTRAAFVNDKGELVGQGEPLAKQTLVQSPDARVGLAIRHTGKQPEQIRVAIAWSDGKLRVWNAEQKGPAAVTESDDGAAQSRFNFNNTATYLPDSTSTILTGGMSSRGGYVRFWTDREGVAPNGVNRLSLTPPDGVRFWMPRALALASSRADGRIDQAALLIRAQDAAGGDRVWLRLVSLPDFQEVVMEQLWNWASGEPVLASAPSGKHLAVAGNADHSIRIYALDGLQRKQARVQVLRSVGVTMRSVAFVQKNGGADVGLVLSETAKGGTVQLKAEDLVFDFAGRSLTADPVKQKWEISEPAADGWRIRSAQRQPPANAGGPARLVVAWEGPQRKSGQVTINLEEKEEVTAYALLPPLKPRPEPILAVASWDDKISQGKLGFYRGDTGDWVRALSAHTQRIQALAAARDGRLLASTADDQTVCLWTLVDLDKIIGRQGTLWGVNVQQVGPKLVVGKVDKGSSADGKLEAGDVLEGLVLQEGMKPRAFATALEYYNALWDLKPGTKVKLRVQRNGNQRVVELDVGQGVDEQRPLLSLFVTRGSGANRQWIAWTPIGPYDSSGQDVERYLGWHFNPKKLEEPAQFALAGEYRARLYKPKLLGPLLAHADVHKALDEIDKPGAVPPPEMDIDVDSRGIGPLERDRRGQFLVRNPEATLTLSVAGPAFAKNEVESITWEFLDRKAEPHTLDLDKVLGQRLSETIPLSAGRGIYRVLLRLRTREAVPQNLRKELVLRYQPLPPQVKFDEGWRKRAIGDGVVREAVFPLQARVELGASSRDAKVTLHVNEAEPLTLGRDIDRRLTLRAGENSITIRAVNAGALRGYEQFESDERTFAVTFQKRQAPHLLLKTVSPVAARAESLAIEQGKTNVVHNHEIRVAGEIRAEEKLDAVEILDARDQRIGRAEPDKQRFAHVLSLQPGEQEFRFRAKTANSDPTTVTLKVLFQPLLPELELVEPRDGVCLVEGRAGPQVELKGLFTLPAEPWPFKLTIQVHNQDKPVPQQDGQDRVVIAYDKPQLAALARGGLPLQLARLRLRPGDNHITVQASNSWNQSQILTREVCYRRPPRILSMEASKPGKTPFTDILAKVQSPANMPLTRVVSNGRAYDVEKVAKSIVEGKELTTWQVDLKQVPLREGDNPIRLVVSNADGQCLEEKSTNVFLPARGAPPLIAIRKPGEGLSEPACILPLRIKSDSELERVELWRGERRLQSFDVTRLPKTADGKFQMTEELRLSLDPGLNGFRVLAVNDGGESREDVTVNYVEPPVRLVIEEPEADPRPEARLTLNGHVLFQDAALATRLKAKIKTIRIYVNDFLQRPPVLVPSGGQGNRLNFSAVILLNQPLNKIEVVCPDLIQVAGSQQSFSVACAHPLPPATLHVLIVGVGVQDKDRAALKEHALKALQASPGEHGLHSEVFGRVMLHPSTSREKDGLLTDVRIGKVRTSLNTIQSYIDKGSPSDVALIYWLGKDAREEGSESYLPTNDSEFAPQRPLSETGMPLKELLATSGDVQGARVLFLEVLTPVGPGEPSSLDLTKTHAAVLRHAWSNQASPQPGLLLALEEAARGRRPISLRDFRVSADQYRRNYQGSLELTDNLAVLPLGGLVISR